MSPVGYLPLSQPKRVDCDRPLRVVCRNPECGEVVQWVCRATSESRCRPCSERNRRHYARVVETGLSDAPGHAYFLTLTAPGSNDHLRWYQGTRPVHRPVCECHDNGMTMGQWNRFESAHWNRFRTALARHCGDLAYAGAVEKQDRGALHRHVVIRTSALLEPAEVQALALAAGYGCVLDLQTIGSAAGMGRYLSKYVTKGGDRDSVPWEDVRVNESTGEIRVHTSPTYRLRSQSMTWGCTMKEVRATAGLQARARARYLRELALLDAPSEGEPPAADAAESPPP